MRSKKSQKFKRNNLGFTLIELMVSISIIAILMVVALPNLSDYLIKSRVDNEISKLQRLILSARNTAINSGRNVTLCPLSSSNVCGSNWQGELSVFSNVSDNTKFNSATEQLIKIREKISNNDTLTFSQTSLVYSPTGRLLSGKNSLFTYCPTANKKLARGINISLSGRIYASQDTDNDNKDEDRLGNEFSCI